MTLANLDTVDNFASFVRSPTLTVIHFCAEWADQCGPVTEVLKELLKLSEIQNNGTKFALCDAENLSEISLKYKVDSVPTVILFKNGSPIDRVDGADASQITSKVKTHSGGDLNAPQQSLEERLKALINRHNVMVFMKGTRDTPRCGFSRTIIQILNETGILNHELITSVKGPQREFQPEAQYDTFDILTDEEVRQGLKTYSDWPTYPQVYVKGELIGGLDIIKEMLASGELESTLNA